MAAHPAEALSALYEAHFDALLAYARRRTSQLSDAEDVVADTFAVVWRRIGDLPAAEAQRLPWLYGIARRVLANQRRGRRRRQHLFECLRAALHPARPRAGVGDVLEALVTLPERDQEILRLVAWDGLSHAEVGVVLGISPNAAAIRLHRARQRLAAALKGSTSSWTLTRWKGSATTVERGEEVS